MRLERLAPQGAVRTSLLIAPAVLLAANLGVVALTQPDEDRAIRRVSADYQLSRSPDQVSSAAWNGGLAATSPRYRPRAILEHPTLPAMIRAAVEAPPPGSSPGGSGAPGWPWG
ncbi:MAG TPA: hypothetical protein VNT56_01290, partial [Acidimicrobiales bacterium]|nr:hypothetical protein [Acidimicrobiales bacterium]